MRQRIRGVAAVCAVAVLGMTAGPAVAGQRPVDRLVADGYPGAVAYTRAGERVSLSSAGLADRRTGRRADPGDRFRIASNTKPFVSTVLLQLAGEGRLSLDDPVARWLPGVVRGNGNDGTRITVRQLLNHTSGIYDPAGEASFFAPYFDDHDWGHVYRPREVVGLAMRHRPLFAPGTGWSYSNTNYLLAGMIIRAVSGHAPGTEIARRILVPLGLRHTSLPTVDPDIHGRHLHGYDLDGRDITRFSPSYDWTAGAMISTLDELARFHRALFDGRLLRPAQQRALLRTVPSGDGQRYGLGVRRMSVPCPGGPVPVWGHDGGGPGFTGLALSTQDGSRQLVIAANVYDLDRELHGGSPVPRSTGMTEALSGALCG